MQRYIQNCITAMLRLVNCTKTVLFYIFKIIVFYVCACDAKRLGGVAYLARPDLDVEVVALVGDLEDLAPGEAVDAQTVAIDEKTAGADPEQDLDTFGILSDMP